MDTKEKAYTLMAKICSGVGATGLSVCSSFATSWMLGISLGTNVFADSLLTSSSASSDANRFLASTRSYVMWNSI